MRAIRGYVLNMLPYMLVSLPIIILVRVIRVRSMKRNGFKSSAFHETGVVIFFLFYVGVASQTVIPKLEISANGALGFVQNKDGTINLVPFRQIADIYQETVVEKNIAYFLVNIVGNLLFFVPIGLVGPILWRASFKRVVCAAALSSLMIEVLQYITMTGRASDIDDIIINTLGAVVGYLIFLLISRSKHSNWMDQFKIQEA